MSEQNQAKSSSSVDDSSGSYYQRWRLVKDKLAHYGVVVGGLGIILAIALIFFYLLYEVFPLFLPANAESSGHYRTPEEGSGKTVLLALEEQNEVAARFTDTGRVVFFQAATGKPLLSETLAIPQGIVITSFAEGSPISDGVVVYGLSNGKVIIAEHKYQISYANNQKTITPSLEYPLGTEGIVVDAQGSAIDSVTLSKDNGTTTLVAKSGGKLHLISLEKVQSLFADEATVNRIESVIDLPSGAIFKLLLNKEGDRLYLFLNDGSLVVYDINDKSAPIVRQQSNILEAGDAITSLAFLNGDLSLLVGDSKGRVAQWSTIKDSLNHSVLQKIRSFVVSDHAIVNIQSEQRRKGFVAIAADGTMGVYHSTAERELIKRHISNSPPVTAILSPRANALLVETKDGNISRWSIDNPHPEVSLKSMWQKVWYESYPKPDYVWQSSSASNDFEPKYSLTPLVFGTLKAAFYAMLFAMPLALMGAIYTAYFMSPQMRQYVKPTIELMGALPTVILGFLAGLWLAPFIEKHLTGIFSLLLIVPIGVMLFAYGWQLLPKEIRQKLPDGWESALLVPVILICGWFAFAASVPLESLCFDGSLRDWLNHEWGIGYDQRNALVVGIAMGFAVIPTIFSISEDAIFSVPKHLTVGSLALGATLWQTMTKVVLLTASPGIFSAVMIGLGRAIGETMIVLMATGNTPVMDFSVFQGLRTLAANIAVEMPESAVDSTHYRVLFLAALVLFLFTFVFNTLAEIIRQRLREKYSSL